MNCALVKSVDQKCRGVINVDHNFVRVHPENSASGDMARHIQPLFLVGFFFFSVDVDFNGNNPVIHFFRATHQNIVTVKCHPFFAFIGNAVKNRLVNALFPHGKPTDFLPALLRKIIVAPRFLFLLFLRKFCPKSRNLTLTLVFVQKMLPRQPIHQPNQQIVARNSQHERRNEHDQHGIRPLNFRENQPERHHRHQKTQEQYAQ